VCICVERLAGVDDEGERRKRKTLNSVDNEQNLLDVVVVVVESAA